MGAGLTIAGSLAAQVLSTENQEEISARPPKERQ